jgi:acyl-CoA thioesterase
MTDLTTATTPTRLDADRFRADIPEGWQQGRGAFGGLVLATLARAIEAVEASPERTLRTLTAEIAGPVLPGPAAVRVERLRAGTGVSTLAARLEQGGEVLAHAVAVLGRRRAGDTDFCDLAPPPVPPWREVAPFVMPSPLRPAFAEHFELRCAGPLPFTGAAEAFTAGWVRPRDPGPARDAAYVIALADAWWPAIFSRLTAPRPAATLAFTLELLDGAEGLDPLAPLLHSARAVASRDGYVVELRELRGEDGRLLACNQQTFAIIK